MNGTKIESIDRIDNIIICGGENIDNLVQDKLRSLSSAPVYLVAVPDQNAEVLIALVSVDDRENKRTVHHCTEIKDPSIYSYDELPILE